MVELSKSIDIDRIRAAHERIRAYIHRTPVITSERMNETNGASLFFKCENFQKIGAFKARGATNAVFTLDEATANLLGDKLRNGPASMDNLRKVQARREWPTRLIQAMQVFIHRRVVTGATSGRQSSLPLVFRLLKWFPVLRQIPARFIGIGPRPEHFSQPER